MSQHETENRVLYSERKNCRACSGKLESVFDFGFHQIVNFGDKQEISSPLHLVKCESCNLLQLLHTVNPDLLFKKYYYKSGVNQTMRNHLQSIVEDIQNRVHLEKYHAVLDIGSNDATLLKFYPKGLLKIGFEPSDIALDSSKSYILIPEFFSAKAYFDQVKYESNKAKVITAIAMFYDLDDPGKFLNDVKQVLAPDGLFVIEQNYLLAMLDNNRVDNISSEHLCYYSIQTMHPLLENHGFRIEDIKFDEINGGVFRLYIRHKEFAKVFVDHAVEYGLDKIETYHKFVKRVLKNMAKLNEFISERQDYISIDVYGASTRGLMVMQLANLGPNKIRQAVERNPSKVGTKYNGVPVVNEETMRKNPPKYLLVLAPDYVSEFYVREKKFLENGGKFIIPFATPHILSLDEI